MREATHRITTRHGTTVAVERRGKGPPIVLLHGGGHDRHDFDAVVPTLAERFETVALDLPGHGDSEMFACPARARAVDLRTGVLEAFDALGLSNAVVVGNSVGGAAAIELAAERPHRVAALVLVAPSGFVEATPLVRAYCWFQGREFVRRRLGLAFARFYLESRNEHATALLERVARTRARRDFVAMEAAVWRSFAAPSSDLASRAPDVRCPVHIVWGRRDPVLRVDVEGRRVRALLPHATWSLLDTGHVPFVEDPAAFLDATREFLERTRARITADALRVGDGGGTGARP